MPVTFSLIHILGNFYRIFFSEAALGFQKEWDESGLLLMNKMRRQDTGTAALCQC